MYIKIIKPFFDYLFAIMGGLFLLPVFFIVYMLLRFTGLKNPIFKQPRPGKNNKVFHIMKFKTMTDETDETGKLLADDKRITRLGRFLRKTSLDEIPQLLNILKGDISLVGPRPLRVRYLPYYTLREQTRHSVKPGITGLAQVNGRNAIYWDKRLELDAVYVEKISFKTDFLILLKTFVKVFDFSATNFIGETDNLDELRRAKMNGPFVK
ncbi:sugar transferase [Cytophaga sp. FL35]|uniref:sugar transferase n=1 Tax=Cytophaga sp. FL35 TaxID=1904456 RepID=UPI001653606E|nr:sugar transferase [Cytophaga sp. FL35]MBC7000090.1 sugar transferase [Cytophaga sp. FL35]